LIPVNIPEITSEDIQAVQKALTDGWISGEGPIVSGFEDAVAASVGRKFGVAVSNGSDALDLAFEVLEIKSGDEVILPSFAIISCLAPLLRKGVVPVFVDVDPHTWNLDVSQLESAVTSRTRAILVVHTYGLAVEMDTILELAAKYDLKIVEDSAEAHGLSYKGRPCGSMGDISTFSFYANKNVTTGEGGMVLTDDENLAEKLKYFRNLTFRPHERFVHHDLGWNMRLSSLQAALGTSQVKRVARTVERRREIANAYLEALEGLSGLNFQARSDAGGDNGYWVFGITLENHSKFETAKEAMNALAEAGVGSRPFFFPLHRQPLLQKDFEWVAHGSLKISEFLGQKGFYVPNGLGMSDEDLGEAVAITKRVLAG